MAVAEPIVIAPTTGLLPPRLNEVWKYRELLLFLVWRDIKVRYAQTLLGVVWTVFQPLAMMLVYTYAFTQLARIDTGSTPYTLYALSGLAIWTFVSRAVFQGAMSLMIDMPIVTKTAAPRVIIPLAAVLAMFVDFVITFALFLVFAFAYGRIPSWHIVFVPLIVLLTFVLTFGLVLLLSALNVRYRDVGQALPFIIQLWFFLSPVAFPLLTPPNSWITAIQALNPLVGIELIFRWAVLDMPMPRGILVVGIMSTIVIFVVGAVYFGRASRTIADDV